MFKKTAVAAAVAGAIGASGAAQAMILSDADTTETSEQFELYGFVNASIEGASVAEGGGAANAAGVADFIIFNTATDDSGLVLADTADTRIGVRGSKDLGNGLSTFYRFETGLGTSAFDEPGGSVEEDADFESRLAYAGLEGSFGKVQLGQMWGTVFEYSGWNIFRSHGNGGAGYYWATSLLNDDWFGLRTSGLSYTYGGGGYSSDPFTLTVQAVMDKSDVPGSGPGGTFPFGGDSGEAGDPNRPDEANADEETLDALIFGAQASFASITFNGVYYQENNTGPVPEPSMLSLGGRWNSGPYYLGASWMRVDRDNPGGNEPSVLIGLAGYDFGAGLTGHVGASVGDADTPGGVGDLTSYFLFINKNIGGNTDLYLEAEYAETDNTNPGGADGDTGVVSVGIKRSF